ncbi:porin family protein [Membranihabitans marinus]|uniref:porin family protein n=1 Tax=Membranihabitans marinus TaxID=1227546 RepID=UPI001F19F43F|nr:porin family protein [Membranihabitans marinus]
MALKKSSLFLFFILLVSIQSQAQEFSFGFKAGLTNTKNDGPIEIGSNGENLESINAKSAFILSLLTNIRFTDEFSLQGELMYNQKGYNYNYNGPSYAIVRTATDRTFYFNGNRDYSLNVNNTYFQIPLSVSYKFFNRIELQAGVYGSLLVQSTGTGEVKYNDIPEVSGELVQTLSYNFNKDNAGQASPSSQQVTINNDVHTISSQVGAYYDYSSVDKSFFNKIDAGYHVGLNFYINQSLFIGARYSLSALDNTRAEVDRTFTQLQNNELIFKDDEDKFQTLEFSIGFSF